MIQVWVWETILGDKAAVQNHNCLRPKAAEVLLETKHTSRHLREASLHLSMFLVMMK